MYPEEAERINKILESVGKDERLNQVLEREQNSVMKRVFEERDVMVRL